MNTTSEHLKNHWDATYANKDINKLGWFETSAEPTLSIIKQCKFNKDARLLNVGAGATILIDQLLELGFNNIIASDLSIESLKILQERLASKKNEVEWIVDDLTQPEKLLEIEPVDLWNDRAVLHFFTNPKDQETYFDLLKKIVNPSGYAIIAVFNTEGATKCCGLSVQRYNKETLEKSMGNSFKLIHSFNYLYTMPSGDTRPYVYTLFKKI